MSECSALSATRNHASSRPPHECASETTERITSATRALQQNVSDPTTRAEAEALLEQGTLLLAQLGDGPEATELGSALRGIEQALARMTPDEAARTLPARPTSRRASLAQAAQRGVNLGAMAYTRTGDPEDFASAVVGDMSDRHLRALGRLSESDLRATLADHGITGDRADAAIDRVKTKIAGKFQRVVRQRGQRALESAAQRLHAAARPGSDEYNRVAGRLLSGDTEVLDKLDAMGVNTASLRNIVANAGRGDGRATMASLASHLPGAMRQAAENVAEQASEMGDWGNAELYRDATASRSFPNVAQQVKTRWAMGGIVGESVNEHVSGAREDEAQRTMILKGVVLATGVVLGIASGGVGSAMAISALSATAREGVNVQRGWTNSDQTSARAMADLATAEEATAARDAAETTTGVAATAVAVDTAVAGAIAVAHHATPEVVVRAVGQRTVDALVGAIEGGAGLGVEHGAHAVDAHLNGGHH